MIVKCIYNKGCDLPEDLGFESNSIFDLILNKEYVVYAMTINNDYAWYYVLDENHQDFPVWRPCPLFEVVNNRISRYWVYSYKKGEFYIKANAVWAFPEWAEDPDYYDNLSDGEPREVKLFDHYKSLMDLEFPNSLITAKAELGDENWLICPNCIDAWESRDERDALVRCPKCQIIYNNPRYTNGPCSDYRSIYPYKRPSSNSNCSSSFS